MKLLLLIPILFISATLLAQKPLPVQSDTVSYDYSMDGSVEKLLSSFAHLGEFENPFDDSLVNADSINKSLTKLDFFGSVNVGTQFGMLTAYIDTAGNAPLSIFSTSGDLGMKALGLPINLSYNYSTLRNPLGINNYFRLSIDTERLRLQALEQKNKLGSSFDNKISEIGKSKETLTGKLGKAEVLKLSLAKKIKKKKTELASYNRSIGQQYIDQSIPQIDSASIADQVHSSNTVSKADSIRSAKQAELDHLIGLYDTLTTVYNKAFELYHTYVLWQDQLKGKKELLSGFSKEAFSDSIQKRADRKMSGVLSSIKTFDLGLTYPQTTALSTNSIPIQGVNIETQKDNWYMNIAAGVTMNNLMASTDLVQNSLFNGQNLFNQFDFQEVREKQFFSLVKSGYGTSKGSHVFGGIRYQNKSNVPGWVAENPDSIKVPSIGAELDVKWLPKFSKGTIIDLVYGKTSRAKSLIEGSRNGPVNSLFSKDETNTGLVRLNQSIRKLRSEVTGSFRWIDTDADMASMGVLQPNNMRYEIRSNHIVAPRLRIGFNFRSDRNNVRNESDTTLNLNVIGGQFNGKIGKKITYFGSLHYLTQTVSGTNVLARTNNYMVGAGLSAQYKMFDTEHAATLAYNDYLISDSLSTSFYRMIGVQNLTKLPKGSNKFSVSYFLSDGIDVRSASTIIGDEYTIEKKKIRVSIGAKLAISDTYGINLGYKIEFDWGIKEWFHWSFKAEKLVLGDFYNYYDRGRFDRFPYIFVTNLNFLIK